MNRQEVLTKLEAIRTKCRRVLLLLETPSPASEGEIRELTSDVKAELRAEYERMLPERVQRQLSLFEISVYSPTIDEAWSGTGISRLKTDGAITPRWSEVLASIAYSTSKYVS